MPPLKAAGPERSSLTERIVGLLPLPFGLGCVVLTVLIGFPGNFVAAYLDTLDLGKALSLTLSNSGFSTIQQGASLPQGIARAVVFNVFILLALYATRYLRMKILSTESDLSQLSPAGEEGFHESFGAVSSPLGAFLLALVIGPVYVVPRAISSSGVFTLAYSLIGTSLNALVFMTLLWEYLYIQWGSGNSERQTFASNLTRRTACWAFDHSGRSRFPLEPSSSVYGALCFLVA